MIYLYVKKHSITGLKYFGKTAKKNPATYHGSGTYWLKHIKKHGKDHIETLEIYEFDDQDLCSEFALKFSKDNNIVESKEWANLQEENGIDGWTHGNKRKEETKAKMSKSFTGRVLSQETKEKISKASKGKPKSAEHRRNVSLANKGKIPKVVFGRVQPT